MAADDVGGQEGIGLAEHAGFGFNAADAPCHDTDTVDHGGVRVSTEHGIGEPHAVFFPDAARQVFHVDLVDDAVAGRNNTHGFEGTLCPFDETIALGIALEFDFLVDLNRVRPVVDVDFNRMVDDDVNRHQRLNLARRHALTLRSSAHRREVVQCTEADQILQNDTHDHKRNLRGARAFGLPGGECFDVFFADALAVAMTDQCFEHDADRARQAGDLAEACGFEYGEVVIFGGLAGGRGEFLQSLERIVCHLDFPKVGRILKRRITRRLSCFFFS